MKLSILAVIAVLSAPVAGEIYFQENFNDDKWDTRWTVPTGWKSEGELGTWKHTAGEWFGDESDKGIQTSEDARFYGLSAPMSKTFTSAADKTLVIQYSVKHEQKLDCGGAYIKLLPGGSKFDAKNFGGDTPYSVMFGPDICGTSNKRTHAILNYAAKDDNLLINKDVPTETDDISHLYTFVIKPDNTFDIKVDNKSVRSGKLEDHWDMLPDKEIKDPEASKPDDWEDEARLPDPEDKKPDEYDSIPAEIPDPDAAKPEDWDDEDDGEWEPPMLDNPEHKGPWKPNMIDNPKYNGPWVHPNIPNPDYKYDDKMHMVCKDGCSHVGFELWQVKTGTLFDDIIVTDSEEEAEAYSKETFFKKKTGEQKMHDEIQKQNDEESASNMDMMGDMDMDMDMDGMDFDDDDSFDSMGDEF